MQNDCAKAKTTLELADAFEAAADYARYCRADLQHSWQDQAAGRCWGKLATGLKRLADTLRRNCSGFRVKWLQLPDQYDLCDPDTERATADMLERMAANICLLDASGVNDRQSAKAAASLRRTANAVRRAT